MINSTVPPQENNVKQEIQLTRLDEQFLFRLTGLRDYFWRRGQLQQNGSFFRANKKLWTWLKCTKQGLTGSRNRLIAADKIKYIAGHGRQKSSHYWVLDGLKERKPANKADLYTLPPIDLEKVRSWLTSLDKATVTHMLNLEGHTEANIAQVFEKIKGQR